jgi:hypothetical protein
VFVNYVVLWVVDLYLACGQTLKFFSHECEGSDIIFDGEFISSFDYFHLYLFAWNVHGIII